MRKFPATALDGDRVGRFDPDLVAAGRRPITDEPSVAVLFLPHMNPFEFSIACEVFGIRRGEVLAPMPEPRWYELRVCAAEAGATVPTDFGFSLRIERGLDDLVTADTVIVPMGIKTPEAESMECGWRVPALPDDAVLDALRQAASNGARMVSFCSGAFLLAEAGLLDGRRATTHWMYIDAFRTRYPRVEVVPDVLYVDEGDVLTSAGSAAGLDLALHIVRTDYGADAADLVARRTVVPPHRDGGQAQYTIVPPVPPGGTPFGELLDWIVEHLHEPLEVADMATRAAMSERTFARRFSEATGTTPHQWLTSQRVARARQLLETTDLTVDAVAARSGLGTAANLRMRLREAVGVSPTAYRRRFRRAA
ncbi:MAG: helix-turn-helix domain-containing protein [Actinobacteria bacterium]|nr:helix-turn-helix domain-containing protein [Actinomycetota bacterium]